MSISGLVLTLDDDPREAESAVRSLRSDPRLTLGERVGNRLPVVAETASSAEDDELWAVLKGLRGVRFVDVTFVDFADGEEGEDSHADR